MSLDQLSAREEHGGILIGRVIGTEDIEVTGCEFFPSAHRKGALYDFGVRERERAAMRTRQLASRGDRPVGYFRTHQRPGLFLDNDDLALMDEAFREPSSIALIIRPENAGAPDAGFFFRENGEIDRRQTHLVFPFDSRELRARGPIEGDTPPEPPPAGLAGVFRPDIRTLAWAGGAAAVAVAMIAAVFFVGRATGHARGNALALRVQRDGRSLVVHWNRDAAALRDAPEASLMIDDGGAKENLTLDRAELQHGSVQFWPHSSHVLVRMEVANGPNTSESVMAILGPEGDSPTAAEVKPSPVPPVAAEARSYQPKPAPEIDSSPADGGEYMWTRIGAADAREEASAPVLPPPNAATSEPLAPTPAPASAQQFKNTAWSQASSPAPDRAPVAPSPRETAVKPAAHPVEIAVRLEPKPPSEGHNVFGHIPLLGLVGGHRRKPEPDFTPPKPDRPLEPKVPGYMAVNIKRPVDVSVLITIDKVGKVKGTEVMEGAGTGLGSLAAERAASVTWQPAHLGEKIVPSQVVAHYRFRPADNELAENGSGAH